MNFHGTPFEEVLKEIQIIVTRKANTIFDHYLYLKSIIHLTPFQHSALLSVEQRITDTFNLPEDCSLTIYPILNYNIVTNDSIEYYKRRIFG